MKIGDRLRRLREERGLTLEEVGAKIGTARQTVYKYEQGIVSNIPLSKIEQLAQLYAADPAYIMGWESVATAHDATTRRLAAAYASINAEGKDRVASYAEDLSHSGNYRLSSSISIEEEAAQYVSVIGSAAAGAGFAYADDVERLVTAVSAPPHDFAIDVKGDSMFPTIFDGDVAFVAKACDKIDRQIYVLDIDGETVIKRCVFEPDALELISDNPDWATRRITGRELESTRILGRVVGWQSAV